jgi:small subunit ribosomal protein S17
MADETTEQNETPQEQPVEAAPETAAPEAAAEEPAEHATLLTPKQRRRANRARRAGGAKPARTPEERQEERRALRKAKATSRTRRREQERAKKAAAPKGEGTPPAAHEPGSPQVRQGIVVSDKADKTITVRIDIAKRHPRYQKIVRTTKSLHAHDERNDAHEGDTVRVVECRPMSRSKRWRLVEILERAK